MSDRWSPDERIAFWTRVRADQAACDLATLLDGLGRLIDRIEAEAGDSPEVRELCAEGHRLVYRLGDSFLGHRKHLLR